MRGITEVRFVGSVNQDDIGSHVREQHPRERPRPDAEQLDDSQSGQWAHLTLSFDCRRRSTTGTA
jgi:hypothetical protein